MSDTSHMHVAYLVLAVSMIKGLASSYMRTSYISARPLRIRGKASQSPLENPTF